MKLTKQYFQHWGAVGGRTRANRLSKARRKAIAKAAGSAPKKARSDQGRKHVRRKIGKNSNYGRSKVNVEFAAEMFKKGKTYQEIADLFKVTRELVRQKLNRLGMDGADGGVHLARFKNVASKVEKKKKKDDALEKNARDLYDMSLAEIKEIKKKFGPLSGKNSPVFKYRRQKRSAINRGIGWELSFGQWWKIWQESNLYEQRGVGKGYCMARFGDCGPYAVGNVEIITGAQNSKDSFLVKTAAQRTEKRKKTIDALRMMANSMKNQKGKK